MKNKYNVGDKVRTKINYYNDRRKKVDATILEVVIEEDNVSYMIGFEARVYDKKHGCTGCKGFVDQDDIIGSITC